MKKTDFARMTLDCLEFTSTLTKRFSSRLAGSVQCADSARVIHEKMAEFCDHSEIQRFTIHPGSFYSYSRIIPFFYFLGFAMLFYPGPWAAIPAIGILAGTAMMLCIFGFYLHFFDRFFPSKTGFNVIGTIEPTGEARQEIIISGHHDTAPVTRLMDHRIQPFMIINITVPYLYYFFEVAVLLYLAIAEVASAPMWTIIAAATGIPVVTIYFMAVDMSRGTPGAGDNMIATAMVVHAGKHLAGIRKKNQKSLRNTRIVLASFDAEEAGLRGASAYFGERARRRQSIPAIHLNIDSIYSLDKLQVLTSDINGTIALSKELADDVMRIASSHGTRVRPFRMIFGGGATDAAESARAGIPSTTIIGLSTNLVRRGMVYHTADDTVDHIEPAAVTACLEIILDFIEEKESAAG